MRFLMEVSESELKKPKPRRKTIKPFIDHSDPNVPGSYAWYCARGKGYDQKGGVNYRGWWCSPCRTNHMTKEGKCPNRKKRRK